MISATAYPIREIAAPLPYMAKGRGFMGLGRRFLTLTERALKEWRDMDIWVRRMRSAV